jgi:glycosyltransferase involved in cell wall biosynthesis
VTVPHVAIAVLCGTTGGPATYGRKLVHALQATGEVRLSILTDRPEAFEQLPANCNCDIVAVPMRGGIDRLRWQHLAVPKVLRKLRPDVYHDTKNALPWRVRCPSVVTVHDLAYHTVPESFGFASRQFLLRATRSAVRRANAIVVPSQATADDLKQFYPNSTSRTHVVPHGIDAQRSFDPELAEQDTQRLDLPSNYVLHVGTIQARKNVDLVIAAVRQLRAKGFDFRAAIVGRRGWLSERAFAEIERDDTAIWLEHLNDNDLASCYARAAAFVSPSAYEGFGFAVADALAAGVPTVISNVSSLPELCGDAAIRLASITTEAIVDALETLLHDHGKRAKFAKLGRERAAQFSWQACATGHLNAYRQALK